MKLENTLENKAKFFGLYHGQKILRYKEGGELFNICMIDNQASKDSFIELKQLIGLYWKGSTLKAFNPDDIDYWRSDGYAFPWMGISIQQLIDWGWIKIIE